MNNPFPIEKFQDLQTPFYYYDLQVLRETMQCIRKESERYGNYHVHYALKANAHPKLLSLICKEGFGADCVSGGEIKAALQAGFSPSKIVFAGVGKADWEINLALDNQIFCFNVESIPELEIINELAASKGVIAQVAFRINPNVGVHTHSYITTGLEENKFGIPMQDVDKAIERTLSLKNIRPIGLHFHIGSQIINMGDFIGLCNRINEIQAKLEAWRIVVEHINVGGGLGINYQYPDRQPIADFANYFKTFGEHLKLRSYQNLHFELGRSVVGQCGSLISKVLYVKQGVKRPIVILDAGMSDLIRPALYQAYHKIENISQSSGSKESCDIVGPICESADVFGRAIDIHTVKRGDFIALRSAGAYGEVMACTYNCRELPKSYFSEGNS